MTSGLRPGALIAGLTAGFVALALLVAAGGFFADALQAPATCSSGVTSGSPLAAREIPSRLVGLYRQAAARYALGADGWAWLAAVNRIETDFGRDLNTSSAGAIGWMQFEPATWAGFGVDGDGDGRRDPYDPADAIPAAARYLQSLGAPADWQTAVRGYNGGPAGARSPATLDYWQAARGYATAYLGPAAAPLAAASATGTPPSTAPPSFGPPPSAQPPAACQPCPAPEPGPVPDTLVAYDPAGLPGAPPAGLSGARPTNLTGADQRGSQGPAAGATAVDALGVPADQCAGGGAVPLAPGDRAQIEPDGRAASPATAPPEVRAMIAAGNQLIGRPYVYGGGHADWRLAPGYDCSSSVSWALHGAGFLELPEDSTTLEGFGAPGAGLWVTVYANPAHAFVYVAGLRLDTSPQPGDAGFARLGPRWRPATRSTAGFIARHPPGL